MPTFLFGVVTVLDGVDDGGVGAGTPDAVLFQLADQRSFSVPPRRFREALRLGQLDKITRLSRLDIGEVPGLLGLLPLVFVFGGPALVHLLETREHNAGHGRPEQVLVRQATTLLRLDLDSMFQELRGCHLTRDEPIPDESVEPLLGRAQEGGHLVGCSPDVGGANGLVGLLSPLARAEDVGLRRCVVGPVGLRNERPSLLLGLLCHGN